VIAAVAAGLLAQWLFAFQMLGLNFPLWIGVVIGAAWRFRPTDERFDRLDAWLPAAAIVFAAFIAVRADMMLMSFDFLAACVLTLAAAVSFGGHGVTRAAWQALALLGAKAGAVYAVGAAYLVPGLKPIAGALSRRRDGRLMPVLRGLVLALPLLLVFAVLFAAADAVFASQLKALFNIELGPDVVFRTILAAIAGWLFAGTLACAWIAARAAPPAGPTDREAALRVGRVEALVLLVALDVMFAVFAALQAAYLFGGLDTFAVSGMTYSDYARRGFFELMIAGFLAGLVIIILDRIVAERPRVYRLAAAALAALTGIVTLSAFVRLGLYQQAYGWTELRFYALAAIAWLALCVIVTFAGVLTGRARWLPQLIVGAGLCVAFVCNVVGPQAFVAGQNIQRALNPALVAPGGKTGLDVDYLETLGADALPALVAARDALPADIQQEVDFVLSHEAAQLQRAESKVSWPSWNLSRQWAADALARTRYIQQ
jgi:Domain of unknown function (DUF4173)